MSEEQHKIPKEPGLDHTLELLKEGYHFIVNRANKFDSRVIQTRLLGEKAICLIGKEEAELFYDNSRFFRQEVAPSIVQKTLLGVGGVQGLDGEEHRHRKAMFMAFMTEASLEEVQSLAKKEWKRLLENSNDEIKIYDAAQIVLTRVALRWTGVPFKNDEAEDWASSLSPLFEMASNIGPKHLKSRWSRVQLENKIEGLVKKIRDDSIRVDQTKALYHFSWHKDINGELLDPHVVAVEVLNLLRPIVAISVYVDLTLFAVYEHPEEADYARQSHDNLQHFIQEVRRYYPFFPAAIARVKKDFTWKGYQFKENTMTLLDLYGTNHDPNIWKKPHEFNPSRFKDWEGSPFDFIPQGGGEFDMGHRCAGEWITIDIMRVTLDYFLNDVEYVFPDQKSGFDMNDIPPISGVTLKIRG